jgi:hypothetical protein
MTQLKRAIVAVLAVWSVALLVRPGLAEDPPAKLTAQELDGLWTDLYGDDATKAYKAINTLEVSADQAIALFKERVKPMPKVDSKKIEQYVADLDSNVFATRRKAEVELEKLGELAELALKKALDAKPPLEVRQRIEALLGKLGGPFTAGEKLRTWRVIEVLETIGSQPAQDVLKSIAGGAPEAQVSQEAQKSLDRLAKRQAAAP